MKKIRKTGIIHIKNTLKNTIFTVTELISPLESQIIFQTSSKKFFAKMKRKQLNVNSSASLRQISLTLSKNLINQGFRTFRFIITGERPASNSLLNFFSRKFKISSVFQPALIPFNGCRKKKPRRV